MKGWAELKGAFWAALEGGPAERARQIAALGAIDPALPRRLEALLAADSGDGPLRHLLNEQMSLERPVRIGGYDILGVLGAGGMGDVYRAVDSRLLREVAIKVLPPAFTSNPERLARFEREAQVLASLNHPHIAQVYGLEGTGNTPALVMELVEGPTLAQMIAGGQDAPPLTTARALSIARQIADGLAAAHEKGIVHRDLKPSNVALTRDGDVKILDFGVAKTLDDGAGTRRASAVATDLGVVLGTPAYMSPEQARGTPVDRRTDIWSFGCLLFELLTGRQPFAGPTPSDSLAAVLEREPDLSLLPVATPSAVRTLVRHCLQKDPKHRLHDIADARLVLEDAVNGVEDGIRAGNAPPRWRRRALVAGPVVLIVLAASTALFAPRLLTPRPSTELGPRTITSIVLPRGMRLAGGDLKGRGSEARFAVSPDGRKLALVAAIGSGQTSLWIRDLASAAFQPVPGTDDASFPFWSPDSDAVAFVAADKLKVIRLTGATVTTLHDGGFRSGAWSRQGLILFPPALASPLSVIALSGGAPTPATTLDTQGGEVQHEYPAFLPDGRHFLYFSIGSRSSALDPRGVYLASLESPGSATLLLAGATQPQFANGHVLFVQKGTLLAQRFDAARGALAGTPVPLVEDVRLSIVGATGATAAYSVSDSTLAYQAALRTESRPVWFDRTGKQLAVLAPPGDYGDVTLSPDGTRVAVSLRDAERLTHDLWLYDATGGQGQRFTLAAADEFAPVWSADGTRLLFSAVSNGAVNLLVQNVSGIGEAAPLEVDRLGLGRYAADWSRDGRHILYIGGGRAIGRSDLWTAPIARPEKAQPLLDAGFVETHGRFSPDGKWFAYTSNETGRFEVYADRFPERGAKRRVSPSGGAWPRWSRDGREIFYLTPDNQLVAAVVQAVGDRLEVAAPRQLFTLRARPMGRLDAYPYDVSPDGRRVVVNTFVEDDSSHTITLVQNWAPSAAKR